MKRTILSSLIVTLAFATAGVSAAEQAPLKIKGKIVPGACGITLSDGGIIDYKTITAAMLDKDGKPTNLDVKKLTVNITCEQKMLVKFNLIDNRSSSVPKSPGNDAHVIAKHQKGDLTWGTMRSSPELVMGLGKAHNGGNIGASVIVSESRQYDGITGGELMELDTVLISTNPFGGMFFTNGWMYHMSGTKGNRVDQKPEAAFVHLFNYNVYTTLVPQKELDLSKAVTLDGNGTFTLAYM